LYRRIYFYLNILIVLSIAVPWAMITSPIQAASQVDNVSSDPRNSTNIIRDQLHSDQSNISSAVDSDSKDIYPVQTFIPLPTQYVPHKNLPPPMTHVSHRKLALHGAVTYFRLTYDQIDWIWEGAKSEDTHFPNTNSDHAWDPDVNTGWFGGNALTRLELLFWDSVNARDDAATPAYSLVDPHTSDKYEDWLKGQAYKNTDDWIIANPAPSLDKLNINVLTIYDRLNDVEWDPDAEDWQ
jgi:hypothetical protein